MRSPQDTFEAGKRYRTLLTFKCLPGCVFSGEDTTVVVNGTAVTGELVTAEADKFSMVVLFF